MLPGDGRGQDVLVGTLDPIVPLGDPCIPANLGHPGLGDVLSPPATGSPDRVGPEARGGEDLANAPPGRPGASWRDVRGPGRRVVAPRGPDGLGGVLPDAVPSRPGSPGWRPGLRLRLDPEPGGDTLKAGTAVPAPGVHWPVENRPDSSHRRPERVVFLYLYRTPTASQA